MNFTFLLGQSTGSIRKLFSFTSNSWLVLAFLAGTGGITNAQADGMFVAPKFVWDKHKDINEPTQKAIMVYDAGREDLILQVKYEGPVDEFGWLIPVPNLPTVQEGSMKCFYELSQYTQQHFGEGQFMPGTESLGTKGYDAKSEPPVKVIETKTVGAYQIAVLSTKDARALETWLAANHFYFPTNKTSVLDTYVNQHWYFIAVKINLRQSVARTIASEFKLASGELHPLQISFASDRCVYPLKISSVNGRPSEVQVYVLSPEPLLERTILEKKLPTIYSNDLARARKSAESHERFLLMSRDRNMRFMGGTPSANSPLPPEEEQAIQKQSEKPIADTGNLPPYAKVTEKDLPETSKWISRLADKSWWLTKHTWTFKPEEMRDLEFEPAMSVFADWLGTKYGYLGDTGLTLFGTNGVPTILAAMQNTNSTVRVCAAQIFCSKYGVSYGPGFESARRDPRFRDAAIGWLKDSEPDLRMTAVMLLTEYGNWKPEFAGPVIAMLHDKDAGVRHMVLFGISRFRGDLEKYIPTIQKMLKDPDADTRAASLEIIDRLGVEAEISRADLLSFFTSPDYLVLNAAFTQLGGQHGEISGDEALVMLQSPQVVARLLGLHALDQKPEKQSVELALPLLRDPDEMVRLKAAQTLRTLTGQQFSEDQADEWENWWIKNKTNFVAQSQREESRTLADGMAYHIRGCENYDARNFAQSLADFRKSCELGSEFQDYSWYRIWLIRARSGEKEAATQELVSYLKQRKAQKPPDWPLQVGHFLTSQLSEADFLKAAADTNAKTDQEQHCEAYFYAGMKHLLENDKTTAADYFKKCLATNVKSFEEYQSAEAELKLLASPPK
jgi:hypothetical protein